MRLPRGRPTSSTACKPERPPAPPTAPASREERRPVRANTTRTLPDSAPEADRATPPTPYRARFGYETRSAASTPWSEFAPVIELAYGGHPDPSESREAAAAVF